ncbi:MAG: hypothetical protein ACRKGH_08075 [Dehalogenimonas sp.]
MFVKFYSEDNSDKQQDNAKRNVILANEIRNKLVSIGISDETILRIGVDLSDIIFDTEIIKGLTNDLIKTPPDNSNEWYQIISDLIGWSENLTAHFSHATEGLEQLRAYSHEMFPDSKL